ncbi:hypothetical protein QTN53_14105, partial [Levilactobacillus brevis]
MNDHEMLKQILAAYQNDEINWSQVPAINALIQRKVSQQVANQIDNLANNTSQQYVDHLNSLIQSNQQQYDRSQRRLDALNKAINTAQQELKPTKRQQTLSLIAQGIGIVALITTTLVLLWLIVPMVVHFSGVGPIWHALAPNWSLWGVIKAIVALILVFALLVLEIGVVAVPSAFLTVMLSWVHGFHKPHKN